jgi:HAD superfamily hydrolase (TIGR01459 family)
VPLSDDNNLCGSTNRVFDAYEAARSRLPQPIFTNSFQQVENLSGIADHFDTFLLDGFGVLNVGGKAVPGAVTRVAELRALGKRVLLVTNSASASKQGQVARYNKRGFDFRTDDIISSREPALTAIALGPEYKWGLVADPAYGCDGIAHLDGVFLSDDRTEYDSVDAFLMLGCTRWTETRQEILEHSIRQNPRPVFVGNPDIAAPLEGGFSYQPGYFAHRLADATGIAPQFFGKPFPDIFECAFGQLSPDFDRARTVMVGDSLHTDILGGRAAGIKTALVTDYGTLAGMDINVAINKSGIIPDYVMSRP